MGNCFRKVLKPSSSYDHIAEDRGDNSRSNINDEPDAAQQGSYQRDSHHDSRHHHHGNREEEVVIRVGESTHVHSRVIQDDLLGVSEFPFLSDRGTKDFIRNSHTMFILRGVPGSGKSTLGKRIQKEYPGAVICSADDYFIHEDGVYRYDQSKISKAHEACQTRARESCQNRVPVIIIDNTNTRRWEMSPYVKLAQLNFYYHVIPAEPNTPWRYNAQELKNRTTHGVHQEKIEEMLDNLKSQPFEPLYYGWFLTQEDSARLFELGITCLKEGVYSLGGNLPEDINAADILNALDTRFVQPHLILHCTAKYVAMNPRHEYHKRELVKQAMHRTFRLKIIGFSYTERNIGAKLELDSEELELFESEYENEEANGDNDSRYHANSMVDFSQSFQIQHGCTAHITLTYAHESSARITGKDMLDIWKFIQLGNQPKVSLNTDLGQFEALGDGYFYFDLKSPVILTTLFHGYYPNR